jgi:hypothetical protein
MLSIVTRGVRTVAIPEEILCGYLEGNLIRQLL